MSKDQSSAISLMSLYQVGAHRGGKKSKLNPRLKSQVYGFNRGLCLIDLAQTSDTMNRIEQLVKKVGSKKRQILIVGTSKHVKKIVPEYSEKFLAGPMPYVNSRWLGGALTNWPTVKKTLKTLENLNKIIENEEFFTKLSKNEQLNIVRKRDKINKFFEGLAYLKHNRPGAVLVLNASEDPIAIAEADTKGVPVISFSSTSTTNLPNSLDYNLTTNIHSINAIRLFMDRIVESYNQGVQTYNTEQQIKNDAKKADKKQVKA
jgi:small subunit ribosomal protein S2